MPRTKAGDNARTLSKNHGSVSVVIPAELVRELKWRDNQKVVIKRSGSRLIIEDWKP